METQVLSGAVPDFILNGITIWVLELYILVLRELFVFIDIVELS